MRDQIARGTQARSFTSRSEHHRPRIWRSLVLVLLGAPLFALGLYLVANGLPEMSVRKAEIWFSGGPLVLGAVGLVFGTYGLVSGIHGAMRTGDDAIDLELGKDGVTVRGGHMLPWESIKGVTAVQYINNSKARLLWRKSDLNRVLVLRLKEPLDVPGAASKDGKHTVRVRLLRYPAAEYQKLFAQVVESLRSRRIQVVGSKKYKQT
jgi:hypothetical protein